MEKKVIDLTDCKEIVIVNLPNGYEKLEATKGEDGMIDSIIFTPKTQDPFDLVPKSWKEFCKNNVDERRDILIESIKISLNNVCNTDADAFMALMELRLIWHEWVKVLIDSKHKELKDYSSIVKCAYSGEIIVAKGCTGALAFTELTHAEKFIECFKDLLEKAKILL